MRYLLAVATVILSAPVGLDRPCAADKDCPSPMVCVPAVRGRSCQLPCAPGKAACPDDHRCVKDHDRWLCRPINDELTPNSDPLR